MSRITTLILAACAVAGAGHAVTVAAQNTAAPKAAATAAKKAAPATAAAEKKPAAAPATAAAPAEDEAFRLFRRDLINLLALSGDARKQLAAAQFAAPDQKDSTRSAVKKTPALVKRALELGPQDPLVLWIAASNACLDKPGCADPAALKTLQSVDADNTAVWLLSWPTDGNAEMQRTSVMRMAQTQRYNDYWGADVAALYRALEILPVPKEIIALGLSSESARINFATSIASAFLPVSLQSLHQFCTKLDAAKDEAAVADCITVARKLEGSGTFVAQGIGFAIEEALLQPGVDKDVMGARRRSAAWQKEKFMELSGRFSREPALAQAYVDALEKEPDAAAALIAFLRGQKQHTDPPGDWQPAPPPKAPDPLASPTPAPAPAAQP